VVDTNCPIYCKGTDSQATSRALEEVTRRLISSDSGAAEAEGMDVDIGPLAGSSTQPFAILKPQDCKDMISMIKALISSFVRQYEGNDIASEIVDPSTPSGRISLQLMSHLEFLPQFPKPKAGHALAPYDITRLKSWWRYMTSEEVDPAKRFSKC
jgi:hypothetical protein